MSSRQAQIKIIWVGFCISSYRVMRSGSSWKNSLANSGLPGQWVCMIKLTIVNCQLSWHVAYFSEQSKDVYLLNMAVESSPIFWASPTLADMFGLQTGFFCLFVCFGGSALSSKMITITLSYVFSKDDQVSKWRVCLLKPDGFALKTKWTKKQKLDASFIFDLTS